MRKGLWTCGGGKWRWRPLLLRVHVAGWLVIAWVGLLTLFSLTFHEQVTLRQVELPAHHAAWRTVQEASMGGTGDAGGTRGKTWAEPVGAARDARSPQPPGAWYVHHAGDAQRKERAERFTEKESFEPRDLQPTTAGGQHLDAGRRRIQQVGVRFRDLGDSVSQHARQSRLLKMEAGVPARGFSEHSTARGVNRDAARHHALPPSGLTVLQGDDSAQRQSSEGIINSTLRHSARMGDSQPAGGLMTRGTTLNRKVDATAPVGPRVRQRSPGRAETGVEDRLKEDGFLEHAYNVTASDLLPVDREVPDTRPAGCPRHAFTDLSSIGPVSVVICTHNEAASVLQRTVMSVLTRTPPALLLEVIVVDDNSTTGDPARALDEVKALRAAGKVRLLRAAHRQGLVRSRLMGAQEARGQILVFLDSHCECGVGWLQPLLEGLAHNRRKVVSPYIDVIKSESFAYVRSPDNLQGDFNWRLEFGWRAIPADVLRSREGPHVPISTPVISGGLFAVDRDFFNDIGGYDDLMDIWGGENMELSFRVWMCGGSLEILPCSRVGHVFRNLVPYSFPADPHTTVLTNLARAARVWMDQYSRFFFAAVNMSSSNIGNVTSRVALRNRLQCRNFQWYLDTVAKHLDIPSPHATHYGQLKNKGSLLCLTAKLSSPDDLRLEACQGGKNQTIQLFQSGVLEAGGGCVVPGPNKHLSLFSCYEPQPQWQFVNGHLRLDETGLCVTSVDNEFVRLQPCASSFPFQLWEPSFTFSWPTSVVIPDG